MSIKVTQEHINNGRKSSAFSCPIALAVKDATGLNGIRDVTVNASSIKGWVNENTESWVCKCPQSARQFQFRFDNDHHVEPFEFELDI